ncbi:MAG: T9SS type B sorting domain-containing protein [Polaribacter sp.]
MKNFFPFIILFFTLNIFSQKEANFWYFGNNAALDFNSGDPIPVSGSQLNTTEGCSSFSDADGNLLFYIGAPTTSTENLTVWNKNNQPMPNGVGLQGDASSSQSALTVPAPGRPGIYYIFTVGAQSSNNAGFWYYTIDMNEDGGLGDIVEGPIVLGEAVNHPNWTEKVTAVRAKDCNSFWVISTFGSDYYAYKVNDSGVDITNPVISRIDGYNINDPRGYLKVSPDGTKLVSANMGAGTYLFDFNDETGVIRNFKNASSPAVLNVGGNGYGVEFSLSSQRLYVSTGGFNAGTPEFLYQYNLSESTITEINNSRFNVFNYTNTRGALQLGPNGKIYWSSDGDVNRGGNNNTNSISVINKPEELGDRCDYSHQTVLVGRGNINPTQGLPPFISSLLLPIDIKDSDTNESINNQDLEFCTGQNKTIIPEAVSGTNKTYEWSFDNGTNVQSISSEEELILTNLTTEDSGTYTLKIELTDDCGNVTEFNGTFNIEVFNAASANQNVSDITFCDTDGDGLNTFNLKALKDNEILQGLNPDDYDVTYYIDAAYVIPIANPESFTGLTPFFNGFLWARVRNVLAPDSICFEDTSFKISVTGIPVPTQPDQYRICDDLESGSDTDKVINTFLLNSKDSEILGDLDSNQYTITYHTTPEGAETNDTSTLVDKNTNYTVVESKTLFIRVENNDNTECYDANLSIQLIVDPLPVISNTVDILQCDDDLDRISTINLTQTEISISSNYENETFEYFATEADANSGSPVIDDELRYPVNQTGEAWVRVISDRNCYRIAKINIEVEAAADVAYNKEFPAVCDDFLQTDGTNGPQNNDLDGITTFNFSEARSEILSFFPIALQPDLAISFYETRTDRTAVLNEIPDISNYRNIGYPSNIIRQTIYFKITNKNNNNCSGTGELYLKTNPVPLAGEVSDLELCDDAIDGDGTNGFVQSFDLESKTSTILNGQDPAEFSVTYHLSAEDAKTGNNPQSSLFTNTVKDIQPIFVRVTNNSSGCFTDHTSFNLVINEIPTANFVNDLEICDDNTDGSARNGFSQSIDLESQTPLILGSQDPNIHEVTYHRSLVDAQSNFNPLVSPYSNIQVNRETIYVRIYNTSTMCTNDISNFDVIVNPEPTFVPPTNLSYCDDDLDGDDANGIIQNIDLDSKITEILGTIQNVNDFNLTFHSSQVDATSGANPLASPYTNSSPTETIFVHIKNKQTLCVNDDASFELIVNPLPNFTVTTPQILCLNDIPHNIRVENPADNYTYVWTDENGTVLNTTSEDNIEISEGGKYKVTATTTNGTMCSREETIEVNESNIAALESSFVTIVDESNNLGSTNNLSISIDVINNDLGPGDYQFAVINTDDNTRIPFTGYQNEPLFENLEGGIYQIIVNDKNGCSPNTTLLVSVIQFPKFFTPNGDNNNDTWVVKGANQTFYPNASINIFNRFGNLVAQVPIDGNGWDGTYSGKLLPSDDYWYNVTLVPADTTKPTINKKGNFSLLRK